MATETDIRFRCSVELKAQIEAEAKKLGLSVSAFIRLLFKQWADGIRFEREKGGGSKERR